MLRHNSVDIYSNVIARTYRAGAWNARAVVANRLTRVNVVNNNIMLICEERGADGGEDHHTHGATATVSGS